MTKCPKCQATLPDGAGACQFCGTSLSAAPPPVRMPGRAIGRTPSPTYGQPKWIWPAYYAIAGWWILDGVRVIALSVGIGEGGFGIFDMVLGAVTALVGVGLILRVDLARGIVNILCFLQILDGALSLIIGLFLTAALGFWGAIGMIFSAIRIAVAVLMIFLIGETESHAPNF